MTFTKIKSFKSSLDTIEEIYTATKDTIIGKIQLYNPSNTEDIQVELFFVDKNVIEEYNVDTINPELTKGYHVIIPANDTDDTGSGLTLSENQSVFVRASNNVVIHIFGKIIDSV